MKMTIRTIGLVLRTILVLFLVLQTATPTTAQVLAAKSKPGNAAAKAKVAGKPSGGMQQGIKVHGHWVIEIRNPDGSLAKRREIQNALGVLGSQQLAALLTRNESAGRWVIQLSTGGGLALSPCFIPGQLEACTIAETGLGLAPSATLFPTLTVTLGGASNQVVLSGMATANRNGDVGRVTSHLSTCPGTTAPSLCNSIPSFNGTFSDQSFAGVGSPIVPVVAGQIIQVTVTFSFS